MAFLVGKRGIIRTRKNKPYYGYKVYGRTGMKYSRNKRIRRIIWN